MYSTQNEGKSVIIWYRFIITLKNQICKYMNSVSKSVYINKLGDIVNKYNTYHSTIKMKPVDVKSSIWNNMKYEINEIIRKSWWSCKNIKNKSIFAKIYVPNWSKDIFWFQKIKILFRGHMLLEILKMKKLLQRFTKNNCKKNNQK